MFKSIKESKQEFDFGLPDRLFELAIDGQQFEDITRDESRRIHQAQPAREAVSVEINAGLPRTVIMGA